MTTHTRHRPRRVRAGLAALAVPVTLLLGVALGDQAAEASVPTLSTGTPTNVTSSSVTVPCTVGASGESTKILVSYKRSIDRWSASSTTLPKKDPGSGGTYIFDITGLAASTSYDVRCKASNRSGRIVSTATTFATASGATVTRPDVAGAAPTNVTATGADIRCNVSTNGQETDVWAVWGPASQPAPANETVHRLQPAAPGTQMVTFTLSGLDPATSYTYACNADHIGDSFPPTVASPVGFTTQASGAPTDLVIAAAGDICDPDPATCSNAAELIKQHNPDYFLSLGDNQYAAATSAELAGSFDLTYGQFKNKIIPTIGNHEVSIDPSAADYTSYFATGAAHDAGSGTDFTYRMDLGAWSVIVVNSNGSAAQLGTTSPRYTQVTGLVDAASADADNVIVAMHHPRWSAPCVNPATGTDQCHSGKTALAAMYNYFAGHGVDVILTGHNHYYSRWDSVDGNSGDAIGGVPQILVGTGGAQADPGCSTTLPGNQVCVGDLEGAAFLTLKRASVDVDMRQADVNQPTLGVQRDFRTYAVR